MSGPTEAFSWAATEVAARWQAGQPLLRLMDGQEGLWNAADAVLPLEGQETQAILGVTIDILDILHVASYVWRAAKLLARFQKPQQAFARERLLRILRGEVRTVIRGLRQMATKRKRRGAKLAEISTVCRYFEKSLAAAVWPARLVY